MLIVLLIAFIVYVVAELYVMIEVGQAIGALNTIGLMILISLVGVWLAEARRPPGAHSACASRSTASGCRPTNSSTAA